MKIEGQRGVPQFYCNEYEVKKNKYCLCIPIINEGIKIEKELKRANLARVHEICDIVICDGGSSDGSTKSHIMKQYHVNTLLVKDDKGKQGAQLRMGFWWALQRGYKGIITIDGNNKDSIEDVKNFIEKLEQGYDFIQGSRFISGGKAINTPKSRHIAVKVLHAPIISITAGKKFTDTTNAFRAYSYKYLTHSDVKIFREIFVSYELLAYLSVRASQLKLKTCEIPVIRKYPKRGKIPTKISPIKGNLNLLKVLLCNLFRYYNP
jgi:Glycosyltransferases involved in cell wall biogenesis